MVVTMSGTTPRDTPDTTPLSSDNQPVGEEATLEQLLAAWQDIEPDLRALVAHGDVLTDQQWMDMPEAYRAQFEAMKDLLARFDEGHTSS
jgi:hypothetical protein